MKLKKKNQYFNQSDASDLHPSQSKITKTQKKLTEKFCAKKWVKPIFGSDFMNQGFDWPVGQIQQSYWLSEIHFN